MTGAAMADSDAAHDFMLIQINDDEELSFERRPRIGDDNNSSPVFAVIKKYGDDTGKEYWLQGNAYVLNAQGKTIASRASY